MREMKTYNVLAVDLGASSGRGIVYTFDGNSLREKVVHRFANGAEEQGGHLVWNAPKIYAEICRAVRLADEACGRIDGIGIDTWGVDFGLIGKDGKLLENPRHYRDAANTKMRRKYADKDRQLFDIAGISVNDFNTTYQLFARKEEQFDWTKVQYLLFMPQLFGYLLTGAAATEPTIASTGGFFANGAFDKNFLREAGVPAEIFPPVRKTFETLGVLNETSKTLAGISYDVPVIADSAFFGKYTNELGGDGKVRFLRNIMGMWIIQECRRQWEEEGQTLDYPEIVRLAEGAKDSGAVIDVNAECFFSPGKMADKVRDSVLQNQGIALGTVGEIARCVYASMAKAYRGAFDELKKITGREYAQLQILGGGSKNAYLNDMIGRELGVSVLAGPAEASSLGNALGQLVGLGAGSLSRLREFLI